MADIIDHSLIEIRRELKVRLTTSLAQSEFAQKNGFTRLVDLISYYLVYEEAELSYQHFLSQLGKAENQWRSFMIFGYSLPNHELTEILHTANQYREALDDILLSLGMSLP